MANFCSGCGAQLDPNIHFCPQCGAATAQPAESGSGRRDNDPLILDPGAGSNVRDEDLDVFTMGSAGARSGTSRPVPSQAMGGVGVGYGDDIDYAAIKADKQATTSMILGFLGCLFGCMAGIPALILGLMALPKASTAGKVRAGIGIVMGLLNLALTLLYFVLAATESM
jgi:hypothetical protein